MKRFITILAVCALLISCVTGFSLAESEEFSVRGGIKFGMSPEEVIAIEEANGFYYDKSSDSEILYRSDSDYQLYYRETAGKLGSLQIMRYEYDFDLSSKKLYQLESYRENHLVLQRK